MISKNRIENSKNILGIEGDFDEHKVIESFIQKLNESKTENQKSEVIESKVALLLNIDEERHKNGKAFLVPLRNYCKKCGSKGYIPEREIILEKVDCPDCDATGVKTVPCKKCKGVGYINENICSTCKGSGKYRLYKTKGRERNYYCGRCQGSGTIYEPHLGSNILDFEICSKCKGVGFNTNFPPIVAPKVKDLGEMITQKMEKVGMGKRPTVMTEAFSKASEPEIENVEENTRE